MRHRIFAGAAVAGLILLGAGCAGGTTTETSVNGSINTPARVPTPVTAPPPVVNVNAGAKVNTGTKTNANAPLPTNTGGEINGNIGQPLY